MKLLANENFPLASVLYLRSKGFDIKYIGEGFIGNTDIEVINLSLNESRTILTFDRDYGELIFRYNHKPKKGVIYLRLNEYSPEAPGKLIEEVLNNKELIIDNALTVVDSKSIRQKKY